MRIVEGTLEQAIEHLAKLAADRRTCVPSLLEKRALAGSGLLTSIGEAVQSGNPLGQALLGAGLGAGVGGLSTAYGNTGREKRDRKSILSSSLTGALAGGALGGGIGAARKFMGGGPATDVMEAGSFKDPLTGEMRQIKPEALRRNPNLLAEVKDLGQESLKVKALNLGKSVLGIGGGGGSGGGGGGGGEGGGGEGGGESAPDGLLGYAMKPRLGPFNTPALPWIAGADAAFHMPGLKLGDRAGFGIVDPKHSIEQRHLEAGLKAEHADNPVAQALLKDPQKLKELSRSPLRGQVEAPWSPGVVRGGHSWNPFDWRRKKNPAGTVKDLRNPLDMWRWFRGGRQEHPGYSADVKVPDVEHTENIYSTPVAGQPPVLQSTTKSPRTKLEQQNLPAESLRQSKATGALAEAANEGFARPKLRRIGPWQWQNNSLKSKIMGRGLVYGGLPLLGWMNQANEENASKQKSLRELLEETSTKIPHGHHHTQPAPAASEPETGGQSPWDYVRENAAKLLKG